jgi:hypothetical protein
MLLCLQTLLASNTLIQMRLLQAALFLNPPIYAGPDRICDGSSEEPHGEQVWPRSQTKRKSCGRVDCLKKVAQKGGDRDQTGKDENGGGTSSANGRNTTLV